MLALGKNWAAAFCSRGIFQTVQGQSVLCVELDHWADNTERFCIHAPFLLAQCFPTSDTSTYGKWYFAALLWWPCGTALPSPVLLEIEVDGMARCGLQLSGSSKEAPFGEGRCRAKCQLWSRLPTLAHPWHVWLQWWDPQNMDEDF